MALGSAAFVYLNFSLPIYARELGASATEIGGMYAAFTATLLFVRPLVGIGLDRLGRRRFYVAAFGFYATAMLAFSQADSLWHFYVARGAQGLGAALMWVAARTMIADLTEVGGRAEAMGRLSAASVRGSMLGGFYGFTLIGFLPIQQAWQLAFLGYALMAAIGGGVALRVTAETRPEGVAPGLPSQRSRLTRQSAQLLVLVALMGFASSLIQPIYLIYLQDKFELPAGLLVLAFLPAGILFATLPVYGGRIADRLGYGRALALGVLLAGVVSGALPWMPSVLLVAAFYMLFAVGWCLAGPAENALYVSLIGATDRGRMIGYKEMATGLGSAIGPLVGGMIYDGLAPEWTFALNGLLLLGCSGAAYLLFAKLDTRPATH